MAGNAHHARKIENPSLVHPQAGPGEVLLHIRTTGCGSDVHFWRRSCIGDLTVDGDCILGHEPAGEVIQLGPGVSGLAVGDRVAVEPGVPCGYKVHAARFVHKLPDSISYRTASLLEPLSVALHALRITPIDVGTPVAIFGAGPIGLLVMAVARASGAHPVVITDVDETRLEFARTFEPHCLTHKVEVGAMVRESANAQRMPAVVLECTGIESSIIAASYTVRRGGRIDVVGVSSKPYLNNIPFMHLSLAEVQLRFINRYHGT
ncbi:GroES-like protein [Cadophora sp. DSE1049]|nr:GroES-like protein [Cadophora sp. DSE1049]